MNKNLALTAVVIGTILLFGCGIQSTLIVRTDADCDWKLDGTPQGRLAEQQTVTVTATPGSHRIEARTLDSKDEFNAAVEIPSGGQGQAGIMLGPIRQRRISDAQASVPAVQAPKAEAAAKDGTGSAGRPRAEVSAASKTVAVETAEKGYWIDNKAKLMWSGRDNGANVTQPEAVAYCQALASGGFNNWRLASLDELEDIYDATRTHKRTGIQITSQWVWSATAKSPGVSLYLDFSDGAEGAWPSRSNDAGALCVRRPEE